MVLRSPLVLCCLVAIVACASAVASSKIVALDTEFMLAPADKAQVKEGDVEVQFVDIVEESRCPADATCVWAGQVKARLGISTGRRPVVRYEVLEKESVTVGGYQITVVRVLPRPATSAPIPPAEYRVVLLVKRA